MQKLMLLGDEAIAQASIDAGISGIFAYPGTPSTEITEYVQASKEAAAKGIRSNWSANEKTAMEASIGMSYAGKRSMVCMKHVGLNVAADAFINSAITGANGGMIIVAADDPSMHSSQNEQDSRFYGDFAMIPVLEPSNQQEAYDMVHYGFGLSEKYKIPVMLRITTRLAHSRSAVQQKPQRPQNEIKLPENLRQYVLLPAIARKQYKTLLVNQKAFEEEALLSGNNTFIDGEDKSLGVIACGLAYNYLMEHYPDRKVPFPVLKVSQYPVPVDMIKKLYDDCSSLLILEDGYPFLERLIRGYLNIGKPIKGRLDGTVSRDGELDPNVVALALGLSNEHGANIPGIIAGRPPSMCKGCPHIDSYNAMNEALEKWAKGRVFSDI
ncbi:MAG: indolepyruvate ferredoxin oxidoreductase, partial [Bacteroidales bacterium]|nr:indolepyruvate ferredoxin oxidoreductase [Bacteroidales bacterium]